MLPLRASLRAVRALPSPAAAVVRRSAAVTSRVPAATRSYHDKDIRPRNPGSMDKKDPSVGTGLVGAPACGDVMKLQIKVDEKTGTITDAKFKTFGCGSAIASSSYLTTLVKGMRLDDAAKIRNVDISKELCLPPVKLHCSMLAEDAIKAAIADYHGKNPKASISDLAGTARTLEKETAAA
ncbi:iron sulfur cluster assembly protein [Purpureocillium lilacinum]|uniref:Iron sulfur cluster assembly protein n=1 Tax=Purpureocillium lilacinum TaxID=33203 RepID=A0A179I0D9_PURLI|nr:iron sulfur cluster assembly protein [Purpureocillium lilacinum]OAQ87340.1 iron sulfur cluster assembly protein [Purpureocillium lilacinum]OAQ95291.1 iron sulfur cluster assembly protein [Purpureocillium lilacinum]